MTRRINNQQVLLRSKWIPGPFRRVTHLHRRIFIHDRPTFSHGPAQPSVLDQPCAQNAFLCERRRRHGAAHQDKAPVAIVIMLRDTARCAIVGKVLVGVVAGVGNDWALHRRSGPSLNGRPVADGATSLPPDPESTSAQHPVNPTAGNRNAYLIRC